MIPADVPIAILAGGLGTRLRSVVADRPKVLATVCGRPFLAWWLDALAKYGERDVILCTGYMAPLIEETLGAKHGPLRLHYSVENEPLGTGGCLRQAWEIFRPEILMVLNGDSFCAPDLDAFFHAVRSANTPAGMVLREMDDTSRYGRVELSATERVVAFSEKGASQGRGWINAGVYFFQRSLLESLPLGTASSLEREHFPQWIAQGVQGFCYRGPFLDIGTPESYAEAEAFFQSMRH